MELTRWPSKWTTGLEQKRQALLGPCLSGVINFGRRDDNPLTDSKNKNLSAIDSEIATCIHSIYPLRRTTRLQVSQRSMLFADVNAENGQPLLQNVLLGMGREWNPTPCSYNPMTHSNKSKQKPRR